MNNYPGLLNKIVGPAVRVLLIFISAVFLQSNLCRAEGLSGPPFAKGETITYGIKKLKMNVGTATLRFNGPVNLNGHESLEIVLTAKGFRFFDEEKIYLDPLTFFPLLIRRNLDIFGVKEQIDEYYHLQQGKITIIKLAKGKTSKQVIESKERFDNIYGFIYRYRRRGQFRMGEEFRLHLPTRDVSFKLVEQKKIEAAGQEFDAYHMASVPKKYKVWFDSGPQKVPLMIDGAIGFGHMAMVMKEYAPGQ